MDAPTGAVDAAVAEKDRKMQAIMDAIAREREEEEERKRRSRREFISRWFGTPRVQPAEL